jgi:hypothetical protein
MSILNRPSDGLVSVLVALTRCSASLGAMPKSKLLDLCCPKSLGDAKQDMATKTLKTWIELGLFVVSENDEVKIRDEYRSPLKKSGSHRMGLAEVVRQIVLAEQNSQRFWSEEENKAADFCRATGWMLAQDVYEFSPNSYTQVERKALEQASSGDAVFFQNDTRWSGFVSWSTFLGFGRTDSGKASGGYIVDPTPTVRKSAMDLLPPKKEVEIDDFLDGLATAVPVIDRGAYRLMVEEKLRKEKWKPPEVRELSTSLSRALLRLRDAGDIRLESRSDAPAQVKLIGRDNRVIQAITHVRRGEAA